MKKYGRAEQVTGDNIKRRMHFACWITKATDRHTQSQYEILTAFPVQQWLNERASTLRVYVHCLPCYELCLLHNLSNRGLYMGRVAQSV